MKNNERFKREEFVIASNISINFSFNFTEELFILNHVNDM